MFIIGFSTDQKKSFDLRSPASDCLEVANSIIKKAPPEEMSNLSSYRYANELKKYNFKNSIWNKIIRAKEFENFDDVEYFRMLEIYKSSDDLFLQNPTTIEQKLALIEALTLKSSSIDLPSIQEQIEKLNVFKLKKLQTLMKNFDLSKTIQREYLEDFASDIFLILKGPPVSLLDYFSKNKTAKMNERMMRVLQEDMLLRGLKGVIEKISKQDHMTQLERAQLLIKKVSQYKIWRMLVIPYDLPWIDQIKVSDSLLEKIFLDGLDAHQSELLIELKSQNAIDHYERFLQVYKPVAFGIGFYFYYQKFHKDLEKQNDIDNEVAKKEFLDEFKKLAASINGAENSIKSDEELKQQQFQRVIKSYIDHYHENPTSEEYRELHKKIFGN